MNAFMGPLSALLATVILVAACGGGGVASTAAGDALSLPASPGRPAVPTAVDTVIGGAASQLIGTAGGSLLSLDGNLSIEVPPGAFAQEHQVTIQEITNEAHGGFGKAYRITPEGLNTPKPMTLRLRYQAGDLQGTAPALLAVATQAAQRTWRAYRRPTVDTAARTLSVQTTHFSDWSTVRGAQLRPGTASVKVNTTIDLRMMRCEFIDVGAPAGPNNPADLPVPSELKYCDTEPLWASALENWAVNGSVGGSTTAGTVAPVGDALPGQARYTASGAVPGPTRSACRWTCPTSSASGGRPWCRRSRITDPASPTGA